MTLSGLAVYRPLPGVDVVSIQRTEVASMLSTAYMFGQPDPPWRGRAGRRMRYRGRVYETGGAEVLLIAPGEVMSAIGRLECKPPAHMVVIDPDVVTACLDETRAPDLGRLMGDHPEVIDAFTALCTSVEAGADRIQQEAQVHQFIALAFRHADDRPSRPPARSCASAVARTRAIIHDRYADPLSLDELARAVELSVWHLARSFGALVGVPIHRYLQLVRCDRVMELLRRGRSIADAAAACGFADQPHLNRTLRTVWGFTPGPFARPIDRRKNVQAGRRLASAG